MTNLSTRRILASLVTLSLLAIAPTAAFAFQEQAPEEQVPEEQVTLTGQLAESEAGGYVLIEQESGESITITGPAELAQAVGTRVRLTGRWVEDGHGYRYFAVTKVERAQ